MKLFLWLSLVGACVGCGPDRPVLASVQGTVTLDGKPLAGAAVMLMPEAGGRPARGTTDEQGHFELTTFERGDGAIVGEQRVSVSLVRTPGIQPGEDGLSPLNIDPSKLKEEWVTPQRYASPQTSGLTAEVAPGMASLQLELQSK